LDTTSLATLGVGLVVALHALVTVFPFASAYGILFRRWFAWIHVPLILWAASIPFVSYPCPFTDWEKSLRANAGLPVYEGHFIQHYAYEPFAPHGELVFNATATAIVVPAYVLLYRQRKRGAATLAA
jgi:hypothetical protein